ncbi:MAG TPA: flagellin hook IN motif-containing protein [Tepidisphaeraceae bacterium]|jgi:flagellar hook-associated protein 3|nr:flagellin hook IN motif-containing protein [Tepidisphaeraceae bacterium]
MAVLPTNLARVSNLLRTSVATSSMTKTQRMLLEVQNQLTTGYRITKPSDDPGDSAVIQQLQKTLEKRQGYLDNISAAKNTLSSVDTSLDGVTDLLRQATQIASQNVGSDVTPAARQSAAALIENLYNQAVTYGNTQFEGTFIYGGDRSNTSPFVTSTNGGVKFAGSNDVLKNTFDENTVLPFMVSAQEVFGATSERHRGGADLSPSITAATRLADLEGATGTGVYKGVISIANGGSNATVDLTTADTVGDVITRINAVTGTTDVTASLSADGNSITLTPGTGTVTITDVGGGTSARDLGIRQAVAVASLDGSDVQAKLTPLTPLASLRNGAGVSASGITIANGVATATISMAGLNTVEDLLNAINGSGVEVLAKLNDAGTGIDVLNPVQGTQMTIAENGGTTAADLGLRTMLPATLLADLNEGRGVRTVAGDDLTITRRDGTTFAVDLDGLTTVNDAITAINTAAGTAMASFATSGNGIVLTDATTGTATFKVDPANFSQAAGDLGLLATPASGGTITGADVNAVKSTGVFTHLAELRDALRASDAGAITRAAQGIDEDLARVIRVRGVTGARVQELEARESRITDENVATQSLLANLHETDYTTAITKYTNMQMMLEASMKTTSQVTNTSLLDFLR